MILRRRQYGSVGDTFAFAMRDPTAFITPQLVIFSGAIVLAGLWFLQEGARR